MYWIPIAHKFLVLLLYEYIITADMEVGLIWKRQKRPLSIISIIFVLVSVMISLMIDVRTLTLSLEPLLASDHIHHHCCW
jgi:hypothetical protein